MTVSPHKMLFIRGQLIDETDWLSRLYIQNKLLNLAIVWYEYWDSNQFQEPNFCYVDAILVSKFCKLLYIASFIAVERKADCDFTAYRRGYFSITNIF